MYAAPSPPNNQQLTNHHGCVSLAALEPEGQVRRVGDELRVVVAPPQQALGLVEHATGLPPQLAERLLADKRAGACEPRAAGKDIELASAL